MKYTQRRTTTIINNINSPPLKAAETRININAPIMNAKNNK